MRGPIKSEMKVSMSVMQPSMLQFAIATAPKSVKYHIEEDPSPLFQIPTITSGVEYKEEIIFTKHGNEKKRKRKVFSIWGLSPRFASSSTLGVPPARNPKTSSSHSLLECKKKAKNLPWCTIFSECMADAKWANKSCSMQDVHVKVQNLQLKLMNPISPEDQYDFIAAKLMRNDQGQLQPFGPIPRKLEEGWHQFRLQHCLIYLMQRDVLWISRQGYVSFLCFFLWCF